MLHTSRDHLSLGAEDTALCTDAIRTGSKSFHSASLLLPGRVRLATRALYAFCRDLDDVIDDNKRENGTAKSLRRRLARVYDGASATTATDRAFAAVVAAHGIPRAVPAAMIEGFEWDEAGRRYKTLDDLLGYAARVAGTVGVMMAIVMNRRERHVLARAADLGLAMQLTNIARDVGEDARNGRLYLPLDWLDEAGVDSDRLLESPSYSPELACVVRRLLATADGLYTRALTGTTALPLGCRPAIRSAALIYRDIGRAIADNNFDSISDRAHTTKRRKLELIAYASATPFLLTPANREAAHPATQFLVDASAETHLAQPKGIDAKVGRFLELLETSERRQRAWSAEARGGA